MPNVNLTDSVYDKLKTATTQWIPAAGSAYFGLSQIWGWPAGEEVVGSLAIVATFLGVLLGISSKNYQETTDGEITKEYDPETNRTILALELNEDAAVIGSKNRVVFDVVDKNGPFWDKEV